MIRNTSGGMGTSSRPNFTGGDNKNKIYIGAAAAVALTVIIYYAGYSAEGGRSNKSKPLSHKQ